MARPNLAAKALAKQAHKWSFSLENAYQTHRPGRPLGVEGRRELRKEEQELEHVEASVSMTETPSAIICCEITTPTKNKKATKATRMTVQGGDDSNNDEKSWATQTDIKWVEAAEDELKADSDKVGAQILINRSFAAPGRSELLASASCSACPLHAVV